MLKKKILKRKKAALKKIKNTRKRVKGSIPLLSPEHKFEILFESANDIIVCVDRKGMIVDVNKKVHDILGFRANDVKNRSVFDLPIFDRQYLPRIKKMFKLVVKTGRLLTENGKTAGVFEFVLKHKNGKDVHVESSTRVYRTAGRNELFISIIRDITARTKAEHALAERSEQLKRFMESANEGFVIFDSELNVVDVNAYLLKEFYVQKEDVIGQNMVDFSYDAFETGRYEYYKKVIRTGRSFTHDVMTPALMGNKLLNIKAFKVGDGLGMVIRDITSEKNAEKELRESERRFRILYEAIHAGVIVHTADGRVTHINKPGCRMIGVDESTNNVPLASIFNLVDKDGKVLPSRKHPSFITLRTGKAVRQALRCIRAAGTEKTRWLIINAEPILDVETKKIEEVLLTFFDISDRKNLEQTLKESEHRYRHLFEDCMFGIGISAPDGAILEANKAMQAITGYTMADTRTMNIAQLFTNDEDRQALREILEKQGAVVNYTVQLKRKDGSVFNALVSIEKITIDGKDYFQTICQVINSDTRCSLKKE